MSGIKSFCLHWNATSFPDMKNRPAVTSSHDSLVQPQSTPITPANNPMQTSRKVRGRLNLRRSVLFHLPHRHLGKGHITCLSIFPRNPVRRTRLNEGDEEPAALYNILSQWNPTSPIHFHPSGFYLPKKLSQKNLNNSPTETSLMEFSKCVQKYSALRTRVGSTMSGKIVNHSLCSCFPTLETSLIAWACAPGLFMRQLSDNPLPSSQRWPHRKKWNASSGRTPRYRR